MKPSKLKVKLQVLPLLGQHVADLATVEILALANLQMFRQLKGRVKVPIAVDALVTTPADFIVRVKTRLMLPQHDFVLKQLFAAAGDSGERQSLPELGLLGGVEQMVHFGHRFVGSLQVDEGVGIVSLNWSSDRSHCDVWLNRR